MPSLKKKISIVPGTVIECKSGRYVAFYEHRTDIIANGENEIEVKKNLKEMYEAVMQDEEESEKKTAFNLPKNYKTKSFKQKLYTA